ncbi:MAG: NAD-dependent epimerase/dehydratase family protein [Patescibacteria group bacterium]
MKIIVTGAAGAIGSHLAERLADLGHEVVGIDSLTNYYSPEIKKITVNDIRKKGVKFHKKDLAEDNIEKLVKDMDVVFHLAAQPGISASTPFQEYVKNNIVATQKLLEAVKNNKKLKMFFHASTSSVYGSHAYGDETTETKPTSNYGVTKLAAEQLALSYHRQIGLPVSVLRFFSVYGERERPEKFWHKLIKAMHNDDEITMYEGSHDHVRSYTYISDIIDGCILALENLEKVKGEIFNLGSDRTNTTGEGLKFVEKIMNKKAKIKLLPKRHGDQLETSANIKKIKSVLKYKPKVKLEEGLKRQVDWYKDKIHKKVK